MTDISECDDMLVKAVKYGDVDLFRQGLQMGGNVDLMITKEDPDWLKLLSLFWCTPLEGVY